MTHILAPVGVTVRRALCSLTFLSAIGFIGNVREPKSRHSGATDLSSVALIVSSVVLRQTHPMRALAPSALGAVGTLPIWPAVPTAPERANRRSL